MNKLIKIVRKNKLVSILIIIILVPVMINYLLLTWHFPGAQNADWLGFLSNYSGGIIGGIVAFVVANHQVKIQMEEQIKNEEEVKYINQLPTLINIKFELDKMRTSLENIYGLRDYLDNYNKDSIKDDDKKINLDHFDYEMESLNPDNWLSIHTIQDVEFQTSLIELKNFYEKIFMVLPFNIEELEVKVQGEFEELMFKDQWNLKNQLKLNNLNKEIELYKEKKESAWEELLEKEYLRIFDDMLMLTKTAIKCIDEMMERRHQIRDK